MVLHHWLSPPNFIHCLVADLQATQAWSLHFRRGKYTVVSPMVISGRKTTSKFDSLDTHEIVRYESAMAIHAEVSSLPCPIYECYLYLVNANVP